MNELNNLNCKTVAERECNSQKLEFSSLTLHLNFILTTKIQRKIFDSKVQVLFMVSANNHKQSPEFDKLLFTKIAYSTRVNLYNRKMHLAYKQNRKAINKVTMLYYTFYDSYFFCYLHPRHRTIKLNFAIQRV